MEFETEALCKAMGICDLVLPTIIIERFPDGSFATDDIYNSNTAKVIDHTVISVRCYGKTGWTICDKCVFENPLAVCRRGDLIEEQIKKLGSQAKKDTGPDLSQFWRT